MTNAELQEIYALQSYPQFQTLLKVAKELKTELTSPDRIDTTKDVAGQAWGMIFLSEYIDQLLGKITIKPPTETRRTHE